MKTTRTTTRPANLSIVKLSRGAEWVQFETSKGRVTAWMTSSEGDAISVGLEASRERIADAARRRVACGGVRMARKRPARCGPRRRMG